MVPTRLIPQADRLTKIRELCQAVADGYRSVEAIGRQVSLSPRHVRYYTLAAIALEWLEESDSGEPMVTKLGELVLRSKANGRTETDLIARSIDDSEVIEEVAGKYLHEDELSLQRLTERLHARAGLAVSTAKRRSQTLLVWREQLKNRGWTPPMMSKRDIRLPMDELSVRAVNVLTALGVRTLADLEQLDFEVLRRTRNCGRKTYSEILEWAHTLGMEPGESEPEVLRLGDDGEPPVAVYIELERLPISARARNLARQQKIVYLGELAQQSSQSLLEQKNCGRKTVRELTALLGDFGLRFGMSIERWSRRDAHRESQERESEIRDLIHSQLSIHSEVDSSGDVVRELRSATRALMSDRASDALERWLGFGCRQALTLDQVGAEMDVSRQRVQQIVVNAKDKGAAAGFPMPKLRQALALMDRESLMPASEVIRELRASGLLEEWLPPKGWKRAAEIFAPDVVPEFRRIGTTRFVGSAQAFEAYRSLGPLANRLVAHYGCTSVEELQAQTEGPALPDLLVRHALQELEGFSWLDEESGWFWINSGKRNALLSAIDKVLAVAGETTVVQLKRALVRKRRLDGVVPTRAILGELLRQLPDVEVTGLGIVTDRRPRSEQELLADSERELVRVFRECGPVLTYGEATQRLIDNGMPRATAQMRVSDSPIVRRLERGVYALVGVRTTPGEVEAALQRSGVRDRSRVLGDHGWNSDGSGVWIDYTLSEGAIRGSILSFPAKLVEFVPHDAFRLQDAEGVELGEVRFSGSQIYGLGPFFRRRGGEAGEQLRLVFDFRKQVIVAALSSDGFDEVAA